MRKPAHLAIAVILLNLGGLKAETATEFYQNKKIINLIVSTAPGTGYDIYARAIARTMPKHIPGAPNIVVQNMPGAGGLNATAHLFNVAAKDGTVMATVQSGIPTESVFRPDVARFRSTEFSWIGSANRETNIMILWSQSPYTDAESLQRNEILLGAVGPGTTGLDMPLLANALFGFRFKIVSGYKGSPDVRLAMQRGEVHGFGGDTWSTVAVDMKDLLADKKVLVALQYGYQRHSDLPNVPLLMDFAKNDEDRQALSLLMARQEFGRPFLGPPGIPSERLDALRRAFDKTMSDTQFKQDAEKLRLEVSPLTGEQVETLVKQLAATPQPVVDRVNKLLAGSAK